MDSMTSLSTLNEKVQACQKCSICKLSYNLLDESRGFGKLYGWQGGETKPDVVFIGLNPSYNRFAGLKYAFGGKEFTEGTGTEFVKLLKEIGILERCYVTNAVKCSSLNNKVSYDNFTQCLVHLLEELDIIKPKIVVAMGKDVSRFLQHNVQFVDFLRHNKIEYREIWHPNFVISYKQDRLEEYKENIRKVCTI